MSEDSLIQGAFQYRVVISSKLLSVSRGSPRRSRNTTGYGVTRMTRGGPGLV